MAPTLMFNIHDARTCHIQYTLPFKSYGSVIF